MTGRRHDSGFAPTGRATLAGSTLTCPCHVCALYQNSEEQYAALVPFVREGIEAGDRVVSVTAPGDDEARRNRLRLAGIDVDRAEREGQLEISTWDTFYLDGGHFDADAMVALAQEAIDRTRQLGFKRMRGWANMEWALEDVRGVEQLVVYESRLNHILPLYNDAVVCAYDATRFPAGLLEDVVRAHPHLCADGFAGAHPHYVPPDELVPELTSKLP